MKLTKNVNKGSAGFKVTPEKYELMKDLILKYLPKEPRGLTFRELVSKIEKDIKSQSFNKPMWYAKVVQLDLEARGIIQRDSSCSPMSLSRIA